MTEEAVDRGNISIRSFLGTEGKEEKAMSHGSCSQDLKCKKKKVLECTRVPGDYMKVVDDRFDLVAKGVVKHDAQLKRLKSRKEVWKNGHTHVKSPVASLCFACSSVRNLVRVMMSVLICSWPTGGVVIITN